MKIFVSCTFVGSWLPNIVAVEVRSCAVINDLKTKIRGQEGLDHDFRARWTFEGRHLTGGRTLAECNVREGSVLHLAIIGPLDGPMEISVLTQAGERITKMVASTDTVAYVKSELQDELEAIGSPGNQRLRLFFHGEELQDDRTLEEYGIEEWSCLLVVPQSLGESVLLTGGAGDQGEAALAQELPSRHSRPGETDTGSDPVTEPTRGTFIGGLVITYRFLLDFQKSLQRLRKSEVSMLPLPPPLPMFSNHRKSCSNNRKFRNMFTLEVESSDTTDIVKTKIQCETGILADRRRLYSATSGSRISTSGRVYAKQLHGDDILADCGAELGPRFRLGDSRNGLIMASIWVVSRTDETITLMGEIHPIDPDWETKMLKEKVKRMIIAMEQRRGRCGTVDEGSGSKAFSSGSLDFRDIYISIVLFDGSYVWIKSRDPAHKGVLVRSRKDQLDRVYFTYEPRFKPPREKTPSGTTLKFNYLSLGEYDTPEEAAEVWKMAAYYYGKHDGHLKLADGTHFCVPPMLQALSGTEKANRVKDKVKQVREEFRKELEASKGRRLVIREGFVDVGELLEAFGGMPQLEDQLTSSSQDRSHDVAHPRTERPNTVAGGFEFNTNRGNSDEQLNSHVAELLQANRQLLEQLQQSRGNEQRLLQENEELKRAMLQIKETLKGCMGSTVGS